MYLVKLKPKWESCLCLISHKTAERENWLHDDGKVQTFNRYRCR